MINMKRWRCQPQWATFLDIQHPTSTILLMRLCGCGQHSEGNIFNSAVIRLGERTLSAFIGSRHSCMWIPCGFVGQQTIKDSDTDKAEGWSLWRAPCLVSLRIHRFRPWRWTVRKALAGGPEVDRGRLEQWLISKSTCCSCRGPKFSSRRLCGSSQVSEALIPGNLLLSSGFCGHQA